MRDLLSTSLSFLQGIPAWAQEHATYPLAVVGAALSLLFGMALFFAIVKQMAYHQKMKWERFLELQKMEREGV